MFILYSTCCTVKVHIHADFEVPVNLEEGIGIHVSVKIHVNKKA